MRLFLYWFSPQHSHPHPNKLKSHAWGRQELGARNFDLVYHMGSKGTNIWTIFCFLHTCICWMLNWMQINPDSKRCSYCNLTCWTPDQPLLFFWFCLGSTKIFQMLLSFFFPNNKAVCVIVNCCCHCSGVPTMGINQITLYTIQAACRDHCTGFCSQSQSKLRWISQPFSPQTQWLFPELPVCNSSPFFMLALGDSVIFGKACLLL